MITALEIVEREMLKTAKRFQELTILKMTLEKQGINNEEKQSGIASVNRLMRGGDM